MIEYIECTVMIDGLDVDILPASHVMSTKIDYIMSWAHNSGYVNYVAN